MPDKTCNRCQKTLPISEFSVKRNTKDGLYGFCRGCKSEADKISRAKRACSKPPVDKTCSSCEEMKNPLHFGKNKSKPDGLHDTCKVCKSVMGKDLYKREKTRILDNNKNWRDNNKNKVLDRSQRYYKANKQSFIARSAKRRALKLQATLPLTAEQEQQIQDFYWLAKDLELVSGQKYHVDHIVPLQGDNVCGLHVPWNLQVLPADINLSKGNKHGNLA